MMRSRRSGRIQSGSRHQGCSQPPRRPPSFVAARLGFVSTQANLERYGSATVPKRVTSSLRVCRPSAFPTEGRNRLQSPQSQLIGHIRPGQSRVLGPLGGPLRPETTDFPGSYAPFDRLLMERKRVQSDEGDERFRSAQEVTSMTSMEQKATVA